MRGGGGGGRGGGYGSLVDAGSVVLALTPASQLIAFAPGDGDLRLARIKVAEHATHAYPVVSGQRTSSSRTKNIKCTLWTVRGSGELTRRLDLTPAGRAAQGGGCGTGQLGEKRRGPRPRRDSRR